MTIVTSGVPALVESAGEIGVVASASSLGLPLVDGVNHLLGYHQMALIHMQYDESGYDGIGRVMTYRHPNSDTIVARFYIEGTDAYRTGVTVDFTAGSGATVSVTIHGDGYYWVAFDWGAGDSGIEEITYEVDLYCDMRGITMWSAYRPTLDPASELVIDRCNDTFALAGFDENKALIFDDANNDIAGLAKRIRDARTYTIRQAVSWTGVDYCESISSPTWTNPFGGTWRHRARHLRTGDTSRDYRVFARTYFSGSGGDTYDWRVTSNAGSATKLGLSRAVPGWDQASDDLEIDCTAVDDLTFEMRYNSGAGSPTTYVCDLSIVEKPV